MGRWWWGLAGAGKGCEGVKVLVDKPTRVWVLLCPSCGQLGRVLCSLEPANITLVTKGTWLMSLRLMRWEVSLDYLGGLG